MKILIYDLETTGLDCKKNAIHQFSGKIIIDGQTKEHIDLHMKPFEGAEISQEALNVSGVTEEEINAYPAEGEAYNTIIGLLNKYVSRYDRRDKFYLCGFNIHRFDNDFFRALFERHGNKWFGSYFWSDSLDAMLLAAPYLIEKRPYMPNFKQMSVAKALGITIDESKLHNADYDIELSQQIYDKVCGKY